MSVKNRGFASLSPSRLREVSRAGGIAVQKERRLFLIEREKIIKDRLAKREKSSHG